MHLYTHIPVLLNEVLEFLDPKPGQMFVDCTLGGGGYTEALLDRVGPTGRVLALDLDNDAIEAFESRINPSAGGQESKKQIVLVHGNFRDVAVIAVQHKFGPVNGVVADLGLSSYELDSAGRGISFQKDEPLDMRFDQVGSSLTARQILNEYTEAALADIFTKYGEEKLARVIARNIVRNRALAPLKRTFELRDVITDSVPARLRYKAADNCRRIFQALRIAVNAELENLESFLPAALDVLVPGGVLAVVSFHSLEDRLVKQFFTKAATGCVCPKDFPECVCGQFPKAQVLTKKPVVAGQPELGVNGRAKSAKLRVIRKLR